MKMGRVKAVFVAAFSMVFGWLGILTVPVLILAGLNFTGYITDILAPERRNELVASDKGLWGIVKKIGMRILVGLRWTMDVLINYASQYVGLSIKLPFVVATIAAMWLICNEIISILENLLDIGMVMPPFLTSLAKMIKDQVEDKTEMDAWEEMVRISPGHGVKRVLRYRNLWRHNFS